jgi:hypothetical protein
MTDFLSSEALMTHVRALAQDIGPRPAGHPEEARAREYIRRVLADVGLYDIEGMPFPTWDTWGYTLLGPPLLALAGNALRRGGRPGKLTGGLAALLGAYSLWQGAGAHRQPLSFLFPKRQTANLIARIPPTGERRHTVVLIGHTDTNKHRPTFSPATKRFLLASTTLGMVTLLVNGSAQLAQAAGAGKKAEVTRRASALGLISLLPVILYDEKDGYIDGANDNATAVACLLGLGGQLKQNPLRHTEVWLAFTAAEEVGCLGMHELLDVYGHQLADAWFIDFEMVGAEEIIYVTRHSGLSYLNAYTPDEESLALAGETSQQHPELGVYGRPVVITEEVGSLRGRGYRGLCLAGVGPDGWLANWHQYSDNVHHIEPAGMERAARFALAMMQMLDARQHGETPGGQSCCAGGYSLGHSEPPSRPMHLESVGAPDEYYTTYADVSADDLFAGLR